MSKKLTVADLLQQKDQLKQKKQRTQTLYVESLDAEIVIQEPTRLLALEALEIAQDRTRSDKADAHVIYHCVIEPNLKDPELQKQLGCVEPTDIADIIFRPGEVAAVGGHIMQLAGYGQSVKKLDQDLKN